MGQYRDGAAITQHGHGHLERRPLGRHVSRGLVIQPAVEGFLRVAGETACHQQPRQVQARRCGAIGRGRGQLPARQARPFLQPFPDLP
jgi:hypothetical protein